MKNLNLDDDDLFKEDEEQPEPDDEDDVEETKPEPKKIAKKIEIAEKKTTEKPLLDTFVAFHLPERNGIMNKENNQIVGEDILSILAMILNKLEKIEKAVI